MDRVIRLIHAQKEEIFPYDGSGITAAILDTGDRVSRLSHKPHRTGSIWHKLTKRPPKDRGRNM